MNGEDDDRAELRRALQECREAALEATSPKALVDEILAITGCALGLNSTFAVCAASVQPSITSGRGVELDEPGLSIGQKILRHVGK